jgi:hypothetical protein
VGTWGRQRSNVNQRAGRPEEKIKDRPVFAETLSGPKVSTARRHRDMPARKRDKTSTNQENNLKNQGKPRQDPENDLSNSANKNQYLDNHL